MASVIVGYFVMTMQKNIWQLLRFALVGGVATLVHLTVAMLLYFSVLKNTSVFCINIISFSCALIFSYYGHRYFTFNRPGGFLKFAFASFLGFFINNISLYVLVFFGISEVVGLIVSIIIVPMLTYLLSSIWVFDKK